MNINPYRIWLRTIISHWHEFGPEAGFDELIWDVEQGLNKAMENEANEYSEKPNPEGPY